MKKALVVWCFCLLSLPPLAAAQINAISARDADACSMKALLWLQAAQARDNGVSYSRHASWLMRPAHHNIYDDDAEAMRSLWETNEYYPRVHGRVFRECVAEKAFTVER